MVNLDNPTVEALFRLWLENDQPCRAWCLRRNAGGEVCSSQDEHTKNGGACWFEHAAREALEAR